MSMMDKRYTVGGKVVHLVRRNLFSHSILQSPCGIAMDESAWRGTGSQSEYEKLDSLRLCAKCRKLTEDVRT